VPQVTAPIHDFRHGSTDVLDPYNGAVPSAHWLNRVAYGTWIVVGAPALMDIAAGGLPTARAAAWLAAFVAFGVAFFACSRRSGRTPRSHAAAIGWLAVQSLAALAMIAFNGSGVEGAMLVIAAATAAAVLPGRGTWLWVAGQTTLLGAIFLWRSGDWVETVAAVGAFGGFQVFAATTMSLAISERGAREALARSNAELTATQSLLAENSRTEERLRISRDLHDALGHHLTALSLQLDVASRLASGTAAGHVREAHAITRLLLGDVRSVVSDMRETGRIDLAGPVRQLAAGSPALTIHLDAPASLPIAAGQAHALLRSVQEIITNASRHGGARNLWIHLERTPDGINLHARDDGRGAPELTCGNGLTGMRERFEGCAGRVEFTPGAGRGFEVHGFLPGPESAA
jgi:signal transduction histidine kinase